MTETEPVDNAGGVNTGACNPCKPLAHTSPHSAPPLHVACVQQTRLLACAGKFCSSKQGGASDNPEDPLNLDASQKRRTVAFFYEGQSEFTVRVAPHTLAARTTATVYAPSRSNLSSRKTVTAKLSLYTVRRCPSPSLAAGTRAEASGLAAKQHTFPNAPRPGG